MISLRQHAISLAAVFLALAVGVVLGSGVLSDTLLSGLRDQKKDLQGQIAQLADDKNMLNEKLSAADDFNTQMSGRIVRDALAGKSVVLLRTPDANDDDLEAIGRVLGQSGAATTGTISLTQEFVDANSAEKLRSVVNSSILPAGSRASTTSTTGAPSSSATWAVDPRAGVNGCASIRPSKSPITPSITATSASRLPCRYSGAIRPSGTSTGSRLRPGRPAASAW